MSCSDFAENVSSWLSNVSSDLDGSNVDGLLDRAKKVTQSNISDTTALQSNNQAQKAQNIEASLNTLVSTLGDLQSTLSTKATPTDPGARGASLRQIQDNIAKANRSRPPSTTTGTAIPSAIDADRFIQEQGIYDTTAEQRRQVVNELRDRYYSVNTFNTTREPGSSISDDDGGTVVDVYRPGTPSTVSPDGTVTIGGVTFTISKISPTRPPYAQSLLLQETGAQIADLDNQYEVEKRGCRAFTLVGIVQTILSDIRSDTQSILNSFIAQSTPSNLFGTVDNAAELLSRLEQLNQVVIEGFSIGGVDILGVQLTFDEVEARSNPPFTNLCNRTSTVYCETTSVLSDLLDLEIAAFLDVELDVPTPEFLSDAAKFVQDVLDKLDELDNLYDSLFSGVCTLVRNNIPGTPKALASFLNLIGDLLLIVQNNPFEISVSTGVDEVLEMASLLESAGYDLAATMLAEGRTYEFLGTRDYTYSGRIAQCLFKCAQTQLDPNKETRLRELSAFAITESNRQTVGQRIQDNMKSRFNAAGDLKQKIENLAQEKLQLCDS